MQFEEQVANGKVKEGASLCETCSHAQIVQGYAESQRRVWCHYGRWDHPEPMHFAVKECNEHSGRERSTLRQMEKIAWLLPSKNVVSGAGFLTSHSDDESRDEE